MPDGNSQHASAQNDHRAKTDAFVNGLALREAVFGEAGVTTRLGMSASELAEFRGLITEHWLSRIGGLYPASLMREFRAAGMENYHRLADRVDHKELWPKKARLLPSEAVTRIRAMDFMQVLAGEFGPFGISNEEEIHPEEIYWRIVRPQMKSDVGPLHADAWFWSLGHGKTPPETVRVKVWIPFYCEAGMNGLKVLPGSHRQNWPYHGEMRDGVVKPQGDFDEQTVPMELLAIDAGTLVVFNDRLLHGGAVNSGSTTRVSAEFTMFVPRHHLLSRGCMPEQLDGRLIVSGPQSSTSKVT
jgi:hypothetical protein